MELICTRPKHVLRFTSKISAVSDRRCQSSDGHGMYVTECTQETLILIFIGIFPAV